MVLPVCGFLSVQLKASEYGVKWSTNNVSVSVAILDGRQKRAEELRRLTDQSASMSEDQLSELRADIKVS